MLRAVALAARLDFTIDPPVLDAIRTHRHEIAQSSPPRLLEEYYKILRAGSAEKTFRWLAEAGLLEPISPELHRGAAEPLWRSLAALDAYRKRFESTPDTLTNAILLGSLLVPLGVSLHHDRRPQTDEHEGGRPPPRPAASSSASCRSRAATSSGCSQILGLQRRLRDVTAQPARPARARAPAHLPRRADVARDSRRRARAGRALEDAAGGGAAGRKRPEARSSTARARRRSSGAAGAADDGRERRLAAEIARLRKHQCTVRTCVRAFVRRAWRLRG